MYYNDCQFIFIEVFIDPSCHSLRKEVGERTERSCSERQALKCKEQNSTVPRLSATAKKAHAKSGVGCAKDG